MLLWQKNKRMRKNWIYFLWTIPWLTSAAFVFYFKKQPVPEKWLLSNLSSLEFISDFKSVKPTIDFWNDNPIENIKLDNFSLLAADRIYAYLPQEFLFELKNYYSPAIIESCVRRVKTILISPCSFELKNKALRDPFQFSMFIENSFTAINKLNSLFVFTYGKNEADVLFNAEKIYKQLGKLKVDNKIGQIQSMCSFLVSPEKQILSIEKFNITIDIFKWLAEFEKTVKNEKMRIDIFKGFVGNMRNIKESKKEILSVAQQKKKIDNSGVAIFNKYFFHNVDSNENYCVTKIFVPENVSMAVAKKNILKAIQSKRTKTLVTGEEYFKEKYFGYLKDLFSGIFIIWSLGFLFIFISKLSKELFEKLLFGKSACCFFSNKKYSSKLCENNLKTFENFVLLEKSVAGNDNIKIDIIRKHRKRRGGARRRIDKISILNDDNIKKTSVFYIKRGTGRKISALKKEISAIMRLKKKGVPVPDVAAYGEGNWRGLDQTFFVLPELEGYLPLYDFQILGKLENNFKKFFMKELAAVARKCHKKSIYNVQWFAKHIFIKPSDEGVIKLKLIDLEDVYPQSLKYFLKKCIIPYWSKNQRIKELVHLNTQLFPDLFSFKDRIYFYKSYTGKTELLKKDKKLISKIFRLSNMKGYSQYTTKSNGIFINLEKKEVLKKIPAKSFGDFMKIEGDETITKKRGRTVVTLKIADNCKLYLKRHTKTKLFDSLKELFRYKNPVSNAGLEWNAISELRNYGIQTMPALAMGEKFKWKFWEKQSFLLTEEIKGGISVEKILETKPGLSFNTRKKLAERIGKIGRKLHSAGFVHRDFYLGHFYVVGDLNQEYQMHLIDLQRVMQGAKIFNRWSLKDISALYFSSLPLKEISRTDRMRFLFNYLGITSLDSKSKQFVNKILMKANRIEKHTEKLIKRRIKRGELPPKQVN